MTAQQLKNSILQMAVQGKLVPQDPNDEPASALLERIRAEKEQLIKEGKIKREKNPSVIFRGADNLPYEKRGDEAPVCIADEVPFDIPDSWEWARLGCISNYDGRKTKVNAQNASPSTWGLDLEDIEKGGRITERKTVGERKAVGDKTVFCCGDILYSKLRPYLLKILVAPEDGICTSEIVPFSVYGGMSADYIVSYLKSPYVDGLINSITYGIKMPRVGTETMVGLFVPIPPLDEQRRICAKINELEPHVADYASAEQTNSRINTSFPGMLRKSILQMAVQGKLVPQNPADEPAEVLLARIREQKKQLIKAGKIKRDKHESVIYRRDNSHYEMVDGIEHCIDDELPSLELPMTWVWCKLQTISKKITDGEHKTPRRTPAFVGYYLLSARNIRDGYLQLSDVDYVDRDEYINIAKRCNPRKGDLLISCSGSVGRCTVIADDNQYVMVRSAAMISPIAINSSYLELCIQSEIVQSQIRSNIKQAVQANLFQEAIRNLYVPLPPYNEQKRIVVGAHKALSLIENGVYGR